MAAFSTIIAGVALAATAVGAYKQYQGQKQAQAAANQQIAAQRRMEQLRQKQMELDAARKRREIVRNMIIARSTALANTQAAGAQFGSALPGAEAGIMGQFGVQTQAVNQNQAIGLGMFEARMDEFQGAAAGARAQGTIGLGQTFTSLGGALVQNFGAIERVGTTLFPSSAPTTGWGATVTRA